jgi:MFS family permease
VTVGLAANSIPMMIAAMVLKGIGSGSQQLSIAAIGEIVPNKHRGTAQAVLDLVALPWTVFGALIGNSMVKNYKLSFRINFIIGILLNLLTMTTIYLWYHPVRSNYHTLHIWYSYSPASWHSPSWRVTNKAIPPT